MRLSLSLTSRAACKVLITDEITAWYRIGARLSVLAAGNVCQRSLPTGTLCNDGRKEWASVAWTWMAHLFALVIAAVESPATDALARVRSDKRICRPAQSRSRVLTAEARLDDRLGAWLT